MNDDLHMSLEGLALTEDFEGLALQAYPDPATGGAPFTIGYGHTGPDVAPGMKITMARAAELLVQDIMIAENAVKRLVTVSLNQHQFDALCDFAFNCGAGNLAKSTLLKLVNKSDFTNASKEFVKWDKANGKIMAGIVRRRQAEALEFIK